MWLHRFAIFVSASTVLLIVAGGLVTSTGSGLAVPDWPTTYGWSMFTFPLDKMVGGIFYEHGHRLIATCVGMLTIVLAVWLWMTERRRWLRWLGVVALVAVCAQGLLGGLTVIFLLPAQISIAHAALAEIFFCLTVAIALFTSPSWQDAGWQQPVDPARDKLDDRRLRIVTSTAAAAIYLQILIGATMRHTNAGLAIPDFPLVFGGFVPFRWTFGIAVHYAHRVWALVVAGLILATVRYIWQHPRSQRELTKPAALAMLLALVQIALGGLTVLSRLAISITTAHVVTGALLLATSLVIALRSWRPRFGSTAAPDFHARINEGLRSHIYRDRSESNRSLGARA